MRVVVDISDLTRFGRLLHFEAVDVARRVEPAVADEARVVERRAVTDVPVSTGALRATVRTTGRGLRRRVAAGNARTHYGVFQEFGTHKMAANPFLVTQANRDTLAEFEARVTKAVFAGELMRGQI